MRPPDVSFMRKCMKWYYFERFEMLEMPADMQKREFGYRRAGAGMVRHLQVRSAADLRVLLLQAAPLEVYVSNARYLFPAMPMSEKIMENADLIFDIDSKDMNLECRPSHTVSSCPKCGHATAGHCEACGHRGARSVSLACAACISAAKDQAERLREILADDLGIREGVRVYFSGNEGFHVHVRDEGMAGLGSAERAYIANYVAFRGILPKTLGVYPDGAPSLPGPDEAGWRGRFAREIIPTKAARTRMAKSIPAGGYAAFERGLPGMQERLGARIDAGVTMDVHRIFRMPGTINGKSCMAKVPCDDLKSFDPYTSAVVIHDKPALVRASCPVPFTLMGRRFGPYTNEYVEVPSYAAAYMICKGLAHAME